MVRGVLSLSVLLSLLVLAAMWAMEDPEPWVPVSEGAPPAAAPPRESSLRPIPGMRDGNTEETTGPELPCTGATLLGTLVGPTGELSFAAVDLGDRVVTATFGDGIPCGIVSGIEPDRVLLKGTRGERLVLQRKNGVGPPTERPRFASAGSAVPEVKHHSDGLYELSRSLVEEMFVNPTPELMGTRLTPAVESGQIVGYRVQFPAASPLISLGLRSGDVVRTANGLALNSPAIALDAYQRVREYGTAELEVLRGGSAVKLRYVLR